MDRSKSLIQPYQDIFSMRYAISVFVIGLVIVTSLVKPEGSTPALADGATADQDAALVQHQHEFKTLIEPFLEKHCYLCHDDLEQKADIDLTAFPQQIETAEQAAGWAKALDQLQADLMPPMKKKRPDTDEKRRVMGWIENLLLTSGRAEAYRRKIQLPAYGNLVDHELLFSGEIDELPYTPGRVWRRSPYIFDGDVRAVNKSVKTQNPYTYSTPKTGIRDYALTSYVSSSVVETIVLNANTEIEYQFDQLTGGAERDRKKENQRRKQAEENRRKKMEEARRLLEQQGKEQPSNPKKDKKQTQQPRPERAPQPRRAHAFDPFLKGTDGSEITDEQIAAPLASTFERFASRRPTDEELQKYVDLLKNNIADTKDPRESLKGALIAVYLSPEAIYRQEWGLGPEDEHGRRILSPEELAYALSFALFDEGPFGGVRKGEASPGMIGQALAEGKLKTPEDVERLVKQILDNEIFPPGRGNPAPRLMRFFHEFFGYDRAGDVFKDEHEANLHNVYVDPGAMVNEADALLKVILRDDKHVFERMLSTNEIVVKHSGVAVDEEVMQERRELREAELAGMRKYIDEFDLEAEKKRYIDGKMKKPLIRENPKAIAQVMASAEADVKKRLEAIKEEYEQLRKAPITAYKHPGYKRAHAVTMYNITMKDWKPEQPLRMPEHQRAGILTHPAWLVAHSFNAENDPVHRGIWVYEKLLAGYLADVPPDVDAQIPEDHTKTLRQRMELLRADECWKCHRKINPLGEAFEIYNHYGRWIDADYFDEEGKLFTRLRTDYEYEHNGNQRTGFRMVNHDELVEAGKLHRQPVNARGSFDELGIPGLTGEFADATEMNRILAKSPRVRQSIIRHLFRYFMGRNEMLSDSKTLIDADNAYVESGGSFKAVVVSLLSSDSFLYRR